MPSETDIWTPGRAAWMSGLMSLLVGDTTFVRMKARFAVTYCLLINTPRNMDSGVLSCQSHVWRKKKKIKGQKTIKH